MLRRWAPVVLLLGSAGAGPAAAQSEIVWRVDNPFRLLLDPKLTDLHRQVWESLTDVERLEPITSAERKLEQLFPDGWARSAYRRTCKSSPTGYFGGCGEDADYVNPKRHRVLARIAGPALQSRPCEWVVTPLEGSGPVPMRDSFPCDAEARIDIPFPDGAQVSVFADTEPIAHATIRVRDIFVVGLGDSFASGEGNPDQPVRLSGERQLAYGQAPNGAVLAGYPAREGEWEDIGDDGFLAGSPRWQNQPCHRSLYSYQVRVALQLAVEDPHRAVTFASFACAGAEITWGLLLRYKGTEWAPAPPEKPQIGEAAVAQCGLAQVEEKKYPFTFSLNGKLPLLEDIFLASCPREQARPIDLLLLSVGGNDVGFVRLVANAILDDEGLLRSIGGWMGTVHGSTEALAALPELELRYRALSRAIRAHLHVPSNQQDRVLLTAYPLMTVLSDGTSVCPAGPRGMEVFPEFRLDRKRVAEGERVAESLYRTMRTATETHGWTFVDAHRPLFAGHAFCEGEVEDGTPLADDLRFPMRNEGGAWAPYDPRLYRPYASRRRWFRTPNDAFLTGNYHIAMSMAKQVLSLESVAWFQVVLASTYSGAFHPTAEGHAVIADAVLAKAREVLRKYRE